MKTFMTELHGMQLQKKVSFFLMKNFRKKIILKNHTKTLPMILIQK